MPNQEIKIVERYLKGKSTPSEKNSVELAYQKYAIRSKLPAHTKDPFTQREEGWSGIQHRFRRLQLRRRLRAGGAIAAGILLFLTIGTGIYQWNRKRVPIADSVALDLKSYGDEVLPGSNRAVLRLSDGQMIELDELHSEIVIDGGGVKYADGTRIWDANGSMESVADGSAAPEHIVLTTPRGGQYQVALPDGSTVWLNAASTLSYPLRFALHAREVELEGEAYFDIKQVTYSGEDIRGLAAQDSGRIPRPPLRMKPFVVNSNGQRIQVFGTEFNVSAYPDDPALRTTLVSGKISVSNLSSTRSMILKPGQQAIVQGADLRVNSVDVDQFTAWKDGVIVLRQIDFESLLRQIERWYDVRFDVQVKELPLTFSGEVPRNVHLSEILRVLEMNTNAKFTVKGRRITMAY